MKVQELIDILYTMNPTDEVRILADSISPSIGSSSTASLDIVQAGFDWDNGTVLLHSKETNLIKLPQKNYEIFMKECRYAQTTAYSKNIEDEKYINVIIKKY